jgi:molecular chaperone HscB
MNEATKEKPFSIFNEDGEIEAIPAEVDHFTLLGVRRRFRAEAEVLESRFYELNRKLHPDFFMDAPVAVRIRSLDATARINEAYQTLKDPIARVVYLVQLVSGKLDENERRPPPELFEEIFEAQEAAEEFQDCVDEEEAENLRERLNAAIGCFSALRDGQRTALDRLGAAWDEAVDKNEPAPPEIVGKVRSILGQRNYIENTLTSLKRALEESE